MLRALLAVALVGSMAMAVPARPAAAAPVCAEAAAGQARALSMAGACKKGVVVAGSRTELTQVVARPDGRLTLESAAVPQRPRTRQGGWADLDLGLQLGADGRLRPAVSVADVSFSSGAGPLISVIRGGHTMTLAWPSKLPLPKISGDSATYPDVRPGADLIVRDGHRLHPHARGVDGSPPPGRLYAVALGHRKGRRSPSTTHRRSCGGRPRSHGTQGHLTNGGCRTS